MRTYALSQEVNLQVGSTDVLPTYYHQISGTSAASGSAALHSPLQVSNTKRDLKPQLKQIFHKLIVLDGRGLSLSSLVCTRRFSFSSCDIHPVLS